MDFVEIFNIVLDLSAIYFPHLVGVKLPLCIVLTLSWNAIAYIIYNIYIILYM